MAGDLQRAARAKCDFCEERQAFLYCKADSARLCLACDHHVHSANPLSLKHSRAPLCECCRKRGATLQCEEETRFFCAACEQEQSAHDGEGHMVGKAASFSGCISPGQVASAWKCHTPASSFLDAFVPSNSAVIEKACLPSDGSLSSILASYWTSSLDTILLSDANSCFAGRSKSSDWYPGGHNAWKQVLLEQIEQLQRLQTEGDDFESNMQQDCFQECMAKPFYAPWDGGEGRTLANAQWQQDVVDQHKFSYITPHSQQQRSPSANKDSWNFSASRKIPDTKIMTGYDLCKLSNESRRSLLLDDTNELLRTVPPTSMLAGMENANLGRSEARILSAPQSYMPKMDKSKPVASHNTISGASVPVCTNSSKVWSRKATETLAFNEDAPTPCTQVSDMQVQHKTDGRSYSFQSSGVPPADGVGAPPSLDAEASAQARDCAVTRYKEKKKNRNFEKFVRYESRKARAESRLRVRGRFVKANGSIPSPWLQTDSAEDVLQ